MWIFYWNLYFLHFYPYSSHFYSFENFCKKEKSTWKIGARKDKKEKALLEVDNLIKEFNFNPTLYKLLKEDNLIWI